MPKNPTEEAIGAKIQEIPYYQYHFAPIISHCPLNLGKIDESEIRKCQVLTDRRSKAEANTTPHNPESDDGDDESDEEAEPLDNASNASNASNYVSYKIRYVGKDHLGNCPRIHVQTHMEVHTHLLKSLEKLAEATVVHYDLKANNIMMDDVYHRLIIIDFGISFMVDDLRREPMDVSAHRRIFYNDYNKYPPWCIEIVLMSYLVQRTDFDPDRPVTPENVAEMQEVCRGFLQQVYKKFGGSPTPTTPLEKELESLWTSMVNQPTQAWVKRLTMNVYSWDNYALAMIMYDRLNHKVVPTDSVLVSAYRTVLTDIVMGEPSTRPTAKDTRQRLQELAAATVPASTSHHLSENLRV